METKTYNNYSKKLLECFPKATQKSPLKFQILGIRYDPIIKKHIVPQSLTVGDPLDRIFDPWAKDLGDDKYEGAYIDIAFIARTQPAPVGSPRETDIILGDIAFRRETVGIIEYTGGDRQLEEMALFLFFCNRNESNSYQLNDKGAKVVDKEGKVVPQPWHVAPRFGYIYEMKSKSADAKTQLAQDRLVEKAYAEIDKFKPAELTKYKKGLFPNDHHLIEDEEVILKLRQVAKNDPAKILSLSKNLDVEIAAQIAEFEEHGLIEWVGNKWVWTDTKNVITVLKPGLTKFSCMKAFFVSQAGIDTFETLKDLLKSKVSTEASNA